MKYQEKYIGSREECYTSLRDLFSNLVKGRLEVEGIAVKVPEDKELEYKIKYEDTPEEGQVAIKISWSYLEEVEEEEEEEEIEI